MLKNINDYNNNVSFGIRIKLSDKGLLNLPQKTDILYSASPMDFFYKEPKSKKKLDNLSIKIKNKIRKEQAKTNNSNLKAVILNKSFLAANKIRAFASKILVFEHFKSFYNSFKLIRKMTPSSPQYIEEWAKIGNSVHNKFIDMNIEDGKIEKIAQNNESHIFILNHDNPEKDKFIYPIFNSFLNYAYTAFGKQNDCPRPNILVSQNVIKLVNKKFQNIYKKMGLIPIDASMTDRQSNKNVVPVKYLIAKFLHKKCNLFIFPEGNNSVFKDKTLEEKFQPGVARIITNILDSKDSVKIVPLGISYNDTHDSMGSIHIGDTMLLNKINEEIFYIIDSKNKLSLGKSGNKKTTDNITKLLCSKLSESVTLSKISAES